MKCRSSIFRKRRLSSDSKRYLLRSETVASKVWTMPGSALVITFKIFSTTGCFSFSLRALSTDARSCQSAISAKGLGPWWETMESDFCSGSHYVLCILNFPEYYSLWADKFNLLVISQTFQEQLFMWMNKCWALPQVFQLKHFKSTWVQP